MLLLMFFANVIIVTLRHFFVFKSPRAICRNEWQVLKNERESTERLQIPYNKIEKVKEKSRRVVEKNRESK